MQLHFDIQQILYGDHQALGKLFDSINSAPLALRTNTADKFFARVFNRNPLDPACAPLLDELKTVFVTQICQNDSFYCDPTHPLRALLECLLARASTWYPREAKLNQQFLAKLSQMVHLASALPDTAASLASAIQEFNQWDEAEEKRAAMLEARLCESELNYLKILTAECRVLDLINEALTGCTLPLIFIEYIPDTLKSELQHCAVTTGLDSPFWKLWQRLLPLIAEVFNGDTLAADQQQLYHHIPLMLHELERSQEMAVANPAQYSQMVNSLSQTLLLTIRRQLPELASLDMLPYPAGHSDTRTRATDAVLQQGATLQEGDWILFSSENGQIIRCKLALKNPTTDQLLFVDRTGRKVMIKSSKDFSLCLSTGIAKQLIATPLSELIAELITALVTLHNNNIHKQKLIQVKIHQGEQEHGSSLEQLEQPKQQQLDTEKQQIEQKIRDEQQRHALEFAEKRRLAAEKALAEAKALAEEKTARAVAAALAEQSQQEQRHAEQEAVHLHHHLLAQQQINALNVGAWVERLDEHQQKQRCKLAVFIASAGKYIFVDNLGRKVAQYQREELLNAFLQAQVSIINNGDKFEDQLVKVIRSLRKDVS